MSDDRLALMEHILTVDRRFDRYLQSGGARVWADVDLTMPQLKMLFLVAGKGMAMTHLARTLGMTLSTATGVADRLVEQGLVRRENDPHDRRLVLLRPSSEGTALIENLLQAQRARLSQILEQLETGDLRTVARALDILYEALVNTPDLKAASVAND